MCCTRIYIIISKNKLNITIKYLNKYLNQFWIKHTNSKNMIESKHYGRIINYKHFDRLNKIREYHLNNNNENKKILIGNIDNNNNNNNNGFGNPIRNERYMLPIVIQIESENIKNEKIMETEVFGPFLTIVTINENNSELEFKDKIADLINNNNNLNDPLCMLCIFTK